MDSQTIMYIVAGLIILKWVFIALGWFFKHYKIEKKEVE